ncbi:uncharacterized protein HaLaN_20435, partial [Haematococcus lacustris]
MSKHRKQRRKPAPSPARKDALDPRPESGHIPNLYFRAVAPEQLLSVGRYIASPPFATDVALQQLSPSMCRAIPQSTLLWQALHSGLLSTGLLKDALGFSEERAVSRTGCK